MSEWLTVNLAELASKIAMGPFGSNIKTENFIDHGVPVIRGSNLSNSKFRDEGFVYLSEGKAAELKNSLAFPLDIVITHRGTLGQVAIIPKEAKHKKYVVSQSQMKVCIDREKADPYFIYYFLNSPVGQQRLLANTSQVGVPAIAQPTRAVSSIEVDLPESIDEQRAIAVLLRSLDDKIEINRRINETLEAIAQALFQSWFVDFDPVRAKANGEAPDSICRRLGLTPELLALFPDRLVESALGEIPEGWPIMNLGSLCSRVAMGPFGSDIKTSNFVERGVPVIRGGNLKHGFGGGEYVFLSEEKADALRNANAFADDIVLTHRGTLGQAGLIPKSAEYPRYVVSQSQMVLTINAEASTPRYVYEYLRSKRGQHALLANASQVGVPAIARPTTNIKALELLSPPIELLRRFDSLTASTFERTELSRRESTQLAALRDTLISPLMAGEISPRMDDRA
jgi:type I restriction enzyme S subunit